MPFTEQIVNASLKFIEKRINIASEKVVSALNSLTVTVDTTPVANAIARLENVLRKPPEVHATVEVDLSDIQKTLKALVVSVNQPKKETNNDDIIAAIKGLSLEVPATDFTPLLKAIKDSKTVVPNRFALDDHQFRTLSNSGGSAVIPINTATRVSNTTVAATSSSTEYSYTFPSGTVAWVIKLRDQGTLGYYSWTTGKMPAGGDSTTFMTIPQNFLRSQENVEYTGKTIYLGAEAGSQTFEIEIFRR